MFSFAFQFFSSLYNFRYSLKSFCEAFASSSVISFDLILLRKVIGSSASEKPVSLTVLLTIKFKSLSPIFLVNFSILLSLSL